MCSDKFDPTKEIPVIINADGSVFPFLETVFDITNESEDELRDLIKDYLEKHDRKLGVFYNDR